jgi:hypothetical protein
MERIKSSTEESESFVLISATETSLKAIEKIPSFEAMLNGLGDFISFFTLP